MEDEHTEIPRGDIADATDRVPAYDPGGSGWVTTRVAAEALGVNPRTVRAYIERGDLEARSEGEGIQKAYLVSIDSVYAIRERRGASRNNLRRSGAGVREESARTSASAGGRGETPGSSAGTPAEELTSMIRDLTETVLGQALADCRRWRAQGSELPVSVNLSARSLLDAHELDPREGQ